MTTSFSAGLAIAGFVCLSLTAPQFAAAAPSPAGLSTAEDAVAPLVTQVRKKWKGRSLKTPNWKPRKWRGRGVYRAPRNVYVRTWRRRPYYGRLVGGVALGTIIAASAVPRAPSSELCWYWTNPARTRGYWDYCY